MKFDLHLFTLRQLQYIVAVADHLSFRRAADICHVSQPSLSTQVAQVEGALDVQLFERKQRKVILTVAGRNVVQRARRLLLEADDLTEEARRGGDPLGGVIRIGVIPTISPYLLPTATPKLRGAFPQLTLAWVEDKTEVLVKKLADGDMEAALLALEADVHDVHTDVIAQDPFVLVTRRDHPLAKKRGPVETSELTGSDLLLLDDGHCFRAQALEVCQAAHIQHSEFRATSMSTLVQMVASGVGITLLPALAIATETERARLHVRRLASPAAQRTIALVWRKQSALDVGLQQIAAILRKAYPQGLRRPTSV